jgi:hypothetical protein
MRSTFLPRGLLIPLPCLPLISTKSLILGLVLIDDLSPAFKIPTFALRLLPTTLHKRNYGFQREWNPVQI